MDLFYHVYDKDGRYHGVARISEQTAKVARSRGYELQPVSGTGTGPVPRQMRRGS